MGGGHDFKPEHVVAKEVKSRISDMPVPSGSWKDHYNRRNRKWNMHLGGALIAFGVSFYAVSHWINFPFTRDLLAKAMS